MARAAHLDPVLLLLVALGGAMGTAARYLVSSTLDPVQGWPLATLGENVLGAFLLGLLLEALVRHGDETPGTRRLRLTVGTGLLGGFTTFSSLALETERLLVDGAVGTASGYAVASLVLGMLACLGGVVLAATHHRRRPGRLSEDEERVVSGRVRAS